MRNSFSILTCRLGLSGADEPISPHATPVHTKDIDRDSLLMKKILLMNKKKRSACAPQTLFNTNVLAAKARDTFPSKKHSPGGSQGDTYCIECLLLHAVQLVLLLDEKRLLM